MNLRRLTATTGLALVGALLMTGCSQGPANADTAEKPASASAAASAPSIPKITGGTGTEADPYLATVQTEVNAITTPKEMVYGATFHNIKDCSPRFPFSGTATLPDGSTQENPWWVRDRSGRATDTLKKTFVADGTKTVTAPLCVNGTLTYSWPGYTTPQPVLLKGSYYTLTYAPIAPASTRIAVRNGVRGSASDSTFYDKKGKVLKGYGRSAKAKTWKMKVTVKDFPNQAVTVQKRTVKKVKGKTVVGKWKTYKKYKTNAKSVATLKFTGGEKTWREAAIYGCNEAKATYRIKVAARKNWNATYLNPCVADAGDFL